MREPDGIPPSAIGPATVLVPVAGIEVVEVGAETVLVDGWREADVVSPSGAIIWARIDGVATIAEVAGSIAIDLGLDPKVIEPDVLAFARHVARDGFFSNVDPAGDSEGPDVQLVPIEPVNEAGAAIDDGDALDLDDQLVRLLPTTPGARTARTTLFVHWSPHCGYCASIADLLAAAEPRLAQKGVDLAIYTYGGAESNATQLDEVGWHPRVLRNPPHELGPFAGHGTPAAYHLDADGVLLDEVANGTDDVVALAARLAGITVAELEAERAPQPPATAYLLDRGGSCATGTGAEPITRWRGTHTWRIGDLHLGLRCVTDATAAAMDDLFGPRGDSDPAAGHLFIVDLGDDPTDATPEKKLALGSTLLVRSRFTERILRAMLWRLDDRIGEVTPPEGCVAVVATAVRARDGIVLLQPGLYGLEELLQPAFAAHGIGFVDVVRPWIDLTAAEVVIPEPSFLHSAEAFGVMGVAADASGPATATGGEPGVSGGFADEPLPVRPGRYPLIAWGSSHPGPERIVRYTPAQAAATFVSRVLDTPEPAVRIRELGEVFREVPGFGVGFDREADFASGVAEALGV